MEDRPADDPEPRRALRPRDHPARRDRQPAVRRRQDYPVDRNNFAPRLGFTRTLDEQGKSVVRAGYGMFYNRTILGAIDDVLEFSKITSSNVVNFPNASADPAERRALADGPDAGERAVHQSRAAQPDVPAGSWCGTRRSDFRHAESPAALRAPGDAWLRARADAARSRSMSTTFTARTATCSWRATNPMLRANTTRTGAHRAARLVRRARRDVQRTRVGDGEHRLQRLRRPQPVAREALRQQLVRPDSYSLSKSRGTAENQADKNTFQKLTDLNLDGSRALERRSPAYARRQRPHRDSEDERRDAVGDAALHERSAVLDHQQQHRCRPERRAERSVAGRHLQRHAPAKA